MTDTTAQLIDGGPAVEVIADLARRDAERTPTGYDVAGDGALVVARIRTDERLEVHDLEKYLDRPQRTRGGATVHDPADFAEYVIRLHDDNTTVWADVNAGTVTAVINDHDGGNAGWRDHTVALRLQPDPDWVRWANLDGKRVGQTDFAEFVENVAHTIIDPDAATMWEVATTMSAKRSVDFSQGTRLDTGDLQLTCVETTEARAGATSNVEIPTKIRIRISPWLGVNPIELDARLTWRIGADRRLAIGYQLLRADEAKRDAFSLMVGAIRTELDNNPHLDDSIPVLLGSAPASLR